jgi:eukaryotic-like serine/threonine-protein kinase
MSISESEQYNLLDQLAEEFAARFRRGERPALKEYTDRYPELAEEIRELFPAMVEVEQADGDRQGEEEKETGDSRTANSRLSQIGDYRILREIGRGGMGVVYEAEQISLGRRVALKVLPRQVSGDRLVQERFRREARAAARLHHTNIVPVFEVGQDEDVRFYAMQFIQGQGLDRVITELQQLRDRGGSEHKTKAASPGRSLRPRRHGERSRQGIEAPTIAAGVELSGVLRSILIGRFESGGRALEPEEASPSMLASTCNGNLATATETAAKHRATKSDLAPADTQTECLTAGEIDDRDSQAQFRMGKPQGEPDANGSGTRPPSTTKSHLFRSSPLSPSFSSAVLPGGTQLSSVDSGRLGFFRSLAQIGRQVAGGLAYAHARGIVHRDIKPSNLLLDTEGVVWIADFGLAKAEDEGLTQSGDILGTIRYMAPERFRGEGDARADVYALGMTLYELLTLRPGFDCSDRLKLIEQIKAEEPERPRAIDARIPRDLETIVLKAIEKDPKTRYPSADALG